MIQASSCLVQQPFRGKPATALFVDVTGSSVHSLYAISPPWDPTKAIANAQIVSWSGVTITSGEIDPGTEEIPARPYLDVEYASGGSAREVNIFGPVGTVGLAFLSVTPLRWTDPLIGGSDLYFSLLGVVDVQTVTLLGQDTPVTNTHMIPSWASSFPGFTIGVQAVLFAGPTGMTATNPDVIVFD